MQIYNSQNSINKMKNLIVIWVIIIVIILLVFIIIAYNFDSKDMIYTQMEEQLVKAAQKYVDQSFIYPSENETLIVEYSTLKENNLIDTLSYDNTECDGYVKVSYNNIVYEYKGFVQCLEYTTENYEKR